MSDRKRTYVSVDAENVELTDAAFAMPVSYARDQAIDVSCVDYVMDAEPANVVPFDTVLPLLRSCYPLMLSAEQGSHMRTLWQALTPEQRNRVEGES